jgi:hypothetical protein
MIQEVRWQMCMNRCSMHLTVLPHNLQRNHLLLQNSKHGKLVNFLLKYHFLKASYQEAIKRMINRK